MDRKPIKIITPVEKHEVELKPYLVGREKIALMEVDKPEKAFLQVILSVDGNNKNVEEKIGQFHGKDFDFVLQKTVEVMNDSTLEVKKNS